MNTRSISTTILGVLLVAGLALSQPAQLPPLTTTAEALDSLLQPPADPAAALERLRADLANERVTGFDGRSTTLAEKLERLPATVLDGPQKGRILSMLSEIYEMNVRLENGIPKDAPNKGYQMVNWQHTRTEVNEVLDAMLEHNASAARAGKPLFTSAQIEDAIVAAAFSDSVKTAGPKGNFYRHHLDGAEAARRVASRHHGGGARVDGILAAIREHQIVPPQFMGDLARHGMVGSTKGALTGEFKKQFALELVNGEIDLASARGKAFKGILDGLDAATALDPAKRAALALTDEQAALARALGREDLGGFCRAVNGARDRIANPLAQPRTADGTRVAFEPAEAAALRGIGIDDWWLPVKGSPHEALSTFVRIGDTRANYFSSPSGLAKILEIRGPGTPFADNTVWDSVRSAQTSFDDALRVIPEEYHPVMREMRGRTLTALRETGAEVRRWVDANKGAYGYGPDEKVQFLDRNAAREGLGPEKIARRTELAREIRSRMAGGLRARQDGWANIGEPLYDVEALAGKMARGAAAGEATLLGVRTATVKSAARTVGSGLAIGAGLGVAIEAGRELITEGRVDGGELWNNTLGNFKEFWKPLGGGTLGAIGAGAIAAKLVPGGHLIATGAQFLGGSLGASAATGHLAKEPGRALAGAIGSTIGGVAGTAALGWLLPPVGGLVGGVAGAFAGQVAGEWAYSKLGPEEKKPVVALRGAPVIP